MHQILFVLIGILSLTGLSSPLTESVDRIESYRVIRVSSVQVKQGVLRRLGKSPVRVLAQGERFIVIRPSPSLAPSRYKSLVQKMKRWKGVVSVRKDGVQVPREHATGEKDARPSVLPAAKGKCYLTAHCDTRNPMWPKLQVGADLAEARSKEFADSLPERGRLPRVGVVDSGFDRTQEKGIRANAFKVVRGHESAGNPDIDPDGHGTAVSGMISGKGVGITEQVDLTSYRVTEPHGNGSVSSALLAAAIEKACKENDVVNVSWGGLSDELKTGERPLWMDVAEKEGCLVIKASGNSGFKRQEGEAFPIHSPLLRVGATTEFAMDADFSTKAPLYGPGSSVYTLLSSQHEYSSQTKQSACRQGTNTLGPVNGTSFAAPLVAGVASQVVNILLARGALPEDPKNRISLIKSILVASSQWNAPDGGVPLVNAAVAVEMAIALPNGNKPWTPEAVLQSFKDSESLKKACGRSPDQCPRRGECAKRVKCTNTLRNHLMLCPLETQSRQKLVSELFSLYRGLEEDELALTLFGDLPNDPELLRAAGDYLKRRWSKTIDDRFKTVDYRHKDTALAMLEAASRQGLMKELGGRAAFDALVQSIGVRSYFSFSKVLGKDVYQSAAEQNATRMVQLLGTFPVEDQIRFLEDAATGKLGHLDDETMLGLFYFLSQRPKLLDPRVLAELDGHLTKLADLWVEKKFDDLNELEGTRLAPVLDVLMEKNPKAKAKVLKALEEPVTEKNLHFYSYAMVSEQLLKDRNPLAERLVTDPLLLALPQDHDHLYLVDEAVEYLMTKGSPEAIRTSLRKAFLEGPGLALPVGATSRFKSLTTDRQKALGEDDFFPLAFDVNLKRLHEKLVGKKEYGFIRGRAEVENLARIVIHNELFPHEELASHLDEKKLAMLAEIVEQSAKEYPVVGEETTARNYLMGPAVDYFLKLEKEVKVPAFQAAIKKSLSPLLKRVQKDPSKFPQSLRTRLYVLYGIKESSIYGAPKGK